MHFVIGLFLLCVILAVPALRVIALLLLFVGGIAIGGLLMITQQNNDRIRAAAPVKTTAPVETARAPTPTPPPQLAKPRLLPYGLSTSYSGRFPGLDGVQR